MPVTRASQAQSEALTRTLMTAQNLYETYVYPQLPPALQTISNHASEALYHAYPYLSQTVSLVLSLANASDNSVLSLGIVLITLYIGLRIANYIRRTVLGWVLFAVKLGIFFVLIQVAIYVNNYGVEKAVRDGGWLGGLVWGFLQDVWDGNEQPQSRRSPRGTRSRQDQYNYRRQQPGGGGGARWT